MDNEIKDFLTEAINTIYKDLDIQTYSFDTIEELYDIDILHKPTNRQIRIGFRDTDKKRDFDIIPLQTQNAPLGLIEIITTFLKVFWYAEESNQTITEALLELAAQEVVNSYEEYEEEKLVQ
jgi:hypothetical protein